MKKLLITLFSFVNTYIIAQSHMVGLETGICSFGPLASINYQYGFKILNIKAKLTLIPVELYSLDSGPVINDYYIGIKTNENKRNIISLNLGASISLSEINPIINFGYGFAFNKNHRVITDLSLSQYNAYFPDKFGGKTKTISVIYIEIGYAYKFDNKQKAKE